MTKSIATLALLVPTLALAKKPPAQRIGHRIPDACAGLPAAGKAPFRAGEQLTYTLAVTGAAAGWVETRVVKTDQGLALRATAETNGAFSRVYPVQGRAAVLLGPDLLPRHFSDDGREGKTTRATKVAFGQPSPLDVRTWNGAQEGRRLLDYRSKPLLDTMSALYYLRALPLKDGDAFCFEAYGSWRLWRVTGRVIGREEFGVPAGRYRAIHVEGTATRVDAPEVRRDVHLWFSDDGDRIPVAGTADVKGHVVSARLTERTTK